jgi:AraC family transcriptional regulator
MGGRICRFGSTLSRALRRALFYPAVAEPCIGRILSGAAAVEERELGGPWLKTRVEAGDFFLTASQSPSEVRWRAIEPEPLETMHLYLGLPVFNRVYLRKSPTG